MENNGGLDNILYRNGESFYEDAIINPSHADNCRSACYDCLKVYRNMQFHDLLDWRLGVALINVFRDENYLAGINLNLYDTVALPIELKTFNAEALVYANQDHISTFKTTMAAARYVPNVFCYLQL